MLCDVDLQGFKACWQSRVDGSATECLNGCASLSGGSRASRCALASLSSRQLLVACCHLSARNDRAFSRPRGQGLSELGYEVVSTGGSAAAIEAAGLPVLRVEELTGFPEMLDGAPHYRASAAPDGLRVSAPGISQPLREPCLGHTWNARAAPTTAA